MNNNKITYISLFSSAGIGCYGFKEEGFECIATNELIERRLNIQKHNNKCKYESGYICGDITSIETKEKLFAEIEIWKKKEHLSKVDLIVATPPCQGMSVANHKKTSDEIIRNSLVIESIKIINTIKPKFFIFENVPAFMKTICTDIDGKDKSIEEAIKTNLGNSYSYFSKIINFKNYGACSSRQRALVIGVLNELSDEISPIELYPSFRPEQTLRDVIGSMKRLKDFGEIDETDIYHAFRKYPEHMREWIHDITEGQSAFENKDDTKKPHQIKNGEIVINKQKNGDKYKRQIWDKVGPCIHTRNDQLASQNTVHPEDDRVFSIREIMKMMTVPEYFKWVPQDIEELNKMNISQKIAFFKKEEINIRQSLGEAVPTCIFQDIAKKIKKILSYKTIKKSDISKIIKSYNLDKTEELIDFIKTNPLNISPSGLSKIAEMSNTLRTDHAAYFTSKTLITEMIKNIPDLDKSDVRILEPSVGVGNFLPLLMKKFENKNITFDLIDIDSKSIEILKVLLEINGIPENCKINYINEDFLKHEFDIKYDYIVGNPPFYKMSPSDKNLEIYKKNAINKDSNNICSFFLDKVNLIGNYVALVFPKFLLNTPEFKSSRVYLADKKIDCILDFGEKGFPGVLVETIAILIDNTQKPKNTKIQSFTHNIDILQKQNYIFDSKFPYWIIYRNEEFDTVYEKLNFNVFNVFRDRQITNKILSDSGPVWVVRSGNIVEKTIEIENKKVINVTLESVPEYDRFTEMESIKSFSVTKYLDLDNVYLTPNMTYKPRVIKKPKNIIVNGSIAILIPKEGVNPTKEQLIYFTSDEYRKFYQIARNYQTRSLNVDSCSVYFYGLLK